MGVAAYILTQLDLHAKFSVSSFDDSRELCIQTDRHGSMDLDAEPDQEYIPYNLEAQRSLLLSVAYINTFFK